MKEDLQFYQALEDIQIEEPIIPEDTLQRVYEKELQLAGLPRRCPRRMLGFLLAAALAAGLMTAAVSLSVSDLFSGAFFEVSSGDPIPVQVNAPLLNQTGVSCRIQAVSGDRTLVLTGIICDDNMLYLLVETDLPYDGKGYTFEKAEIQSGDIIQGMSIQQLPKATTGGDRLRWLIHGSISPDIVSGGQVTLHLDNLMVQTPPETSYLQEPGDSLSQIYGNFEAKPEYAPIETVLTDSRIPSNQILFVFGENKSRRYQWDGTHYISAELPATGCRIPLNGIFLDNIGFWKDYLLINLYGDPEKQSILKNGELSIIDPGSGEVLSSGQGMEDREASVWRYELPQVASEDLEHGILAITMPEQWQAQQQASWDFPFGLPSSSAGISRQTSQPFSLGDIPMEMESITVSPISVSVTAAPVEKGGSSKIAGFQSTVFGGILDSPQLESGSNWLILKDGTKIPLIGLSLKGEDTIQIQYALPVVINPEDCTALLLYGEDFPFQ